MNQFQESGGMEAARQALIDRLTEAFSSDAIGMEEYERRASAASSATSVVELERLAFDLPARGSARTASSGAEHYGIRPDSSLIGKPSITTGCVMGERSMNGNWLSSDRVSSFTVMGTTRLDFTEVDLPPGPVKVEVFTLMGETRIVVPRNLPVKMDAFVFMGESRAGRDVNQRTAGAVTWLEVSGFSMMGSVSVRAAG